MRYLFLPLLTMIIIIQPTTGYAETGLSAKHGIQKNHVVDIEITDEITLKGSYFNPGKEGPGLLILHQCAPNASRTGWVKMAQTLSDSGFHVLTIDWPGFGDSGGEKPNAGPGLKEFLKYIRANWRDDVETALNYLKSQNGVDPNLIGTLGASCGMIMSMELAASHPEIKAQLLLTGPIDDISLEQLRKTSNIHRIGITGLDDQSFPFMRQVEEVITAESGYMMYLPNGVGHGSEVFKNLPELHKMVSLWFTIHMK
jgi:dienelactone hydrolase